MNAVADADAIVGEHRPVYRAYLFPMLVEFESTSEHMEDVLSGGQVAKGCMSTSFWLPIPDITTDITDSYLPIFFRLY